MPEHTKNWKRMYDEAQRRYAELRDRVKPELLDAQAARLVSLEESLSGARQAIIQLNGACNDWAEQVEVLKSALASEAERVAAAEAVADELRAAHRKTQDRINEVRHEAWAILRAEKKARTGDDTTKVYQRMFRLVVKIVNEFA